jgi:hypothetical protein
MTSGRLRDVTEATIRSRVVGAGRMIFHERSSPSAGRKTAVTALNREAQPVTIRPATEHLGLVGLGERPVPSQFLIGGIFREDYRIAALPRCENQRTGHNLFSRRH